MRQSPSRAARWNMTVRTWNISGNLTRRRPVDSRMACRRWRWGTTITSAARRLEVACYGKPSPEDRWALEPLTAIFPPNQKMPVVDEKTRKAVDEALFSYRRTAQV